MLHTVCTVCMGNAFHTLAAKSIAGILQIMEMGQQKKHPMKVTMDRMREVFPFECMVRCKVEGNTVVLHTMGGGTRG